MVRFTEVYSRLGVEAEELFPEFPWRQARRMRNLLVHRYSVIDYPRVWAGLDRFAELGLRRRPPPARRQRSLLKLRLEEDLVFEDPAPGSLFDLLPTGRITPVEVKGKREQGHRAPSCPWRGAQAGPRSSDAAQGRDIDALTGRRQCWIIRS